MRVLVRRFGGTPSRPWVGWLTLLLVLALVLWYLAAVAPAWLPAPGGHVALPLFLTWVSAALGGG